MAFVAYGAFLWMVANWLIQKVQDYLFVADLR